VTKGGLLIVVVMSRVVLPSLVVLGVVLPQAPWVQAQGSVLPKCCLKLHGSMHKGNGSYGHSG
jgi:hypothetical protein